MELITNPKYELTGTEKAIANYAASWLKWLDASNRTEETYTKNLRQFVYWLDEKNITAPTREDIIAYRDYLSQEHKPSTVQGYLMALKQFFKWTASNHIYENITEGVKAPKLDRNFKKDYLTSNQAKQILGLIDTSTEGGKRDYAIISLMLTTGLRTVSVANALIEDIKPCGDSMVLYYLGKGHNEKGTYVKLAEPVLKAIRDYLQTRTNKNGKSPLFASTAHRNSGEAMTTKSISRLVKDSFLKAGYDSDRLTAHSLRHTAATLNLLNGGTLEETQQLLDHSNISTTMIYLHNLERANNQSESRIANTIFA